MIYKNKKDRKVERKMILQYRGFKNNLVYEEVEQVIQSIVNIPKFDEKESSDSDSFARAYRKIDETIRKETNAVKISDRTGKPLSSLGIVKVITAVKNDKEETYLFDMDNQVYLLNENGKTISRL